MKINTHKDCAIVKGIKFFKCFDCGEQSANYANGVDLCTVCCEKLNICCICGKEMRRRKNNEPLGKDGKSV